MLKTKIPNEELLKQISEKIFCKPVELNREVRGTSTFVYRILVENSTFYLRVLPEQDTSFATEVKVHKTLSNLGVKVPKVIHFEDKNDLIGLSLMIVEEIAGKSLNDYSKNMDSRHFENVVYDAGKQLAFVNQIPVAGFGWIDKNNQVTLTGEHDSFNAYYDEHSEKDLSLLSNYLFNIISFA